jgi:hypothetical protein
MTGGAIARRPMATTFGNRKWESGSSSAGGGCQSSDSLRYGTDNRIERTRNTTGCKTAYYLTDQAGNRLTQADTTTTGWQPIHRFTYTAASQLYFSLTPTADIGHYDVNWHWYDGAECGSSASSAGTNWDPELDPAAGNRTYDVYASGSDIAMTILRGSTGNWSVRQRFISAGTDEPIAEDFRVRQRRICCWCPISGLDLAAVDSAGVLETQAVYFTRDAFGGFDQATGSGSTTNSETGFAGGSTRIKPADLHISGIGGMMQRRGDSSPRSHRPRRRVNLYAYAGNNPCCLQRSIWTLS